jgi:ABC-type lipopolysaccharide export system ATPase subunit
MPTSTDSRCPDTGFLTVRGLTAGYGAAPIINDISLTVAEGEVVTVIGPNGPANRRYSSASPDG